MIFLAKNEKKKIREKFQEAMELPKELLKDYSRVTILGAEDIWIENYQSIMEYGEEYIRFGNNIGIYGQQLTIEEITDDDILIIGTVKTIEFE